MRVRLSSFVAASGVCGIAFGMVCALGCAPQPQSGPAQAPSPVRPAAPGAAAPMTHGTAVIRDAAGRRVGDVTFTDSYAGLLIAGSVNDLGLGAHGIHIHEVGKCEAPFTSSGGHFNPDHRQHGFSNPNGPHLGDLPNIITPAAGTLKFEFLLPGVTLMGRNALLDADGSSIVIDDARDDYKTDPDGNSGGGIACGVIRGQ